MVRTDTTERGSNLSVLTVTHPTQERLTTPPGSTSPALFEQQHSKMSTHMTETGNMLNVRKPKKEVLITSVSNNAGKQNKNSVSQSHVKIGNPKRHQIDPSI